MADKKSSPQQISQSVYNPNTESIGIHDVSNLVPLKYDEIVMLYTNTNPEPTRVTYKYQTNIVAVVGFEYDDRGRVTRVYRFA